MEQHVKMLDIKDLQNILKIGKNSAYNLMQTPGFPSMQVGRKWMISEEAFKEWLKNNEYNKIRVD